MVNGQSVFLQRERKFNNPWNGGGCLALRLIKHSLSSFYKNIAINKSLFSNIFIFTTVRSTFEHSVS